MQKKLFALLLVAALAIGAVALTACTAKEETPEDPTTAAVIEDNTTEAPAGIPETPVVPAGNLEELVAQQNAASGGAYTAKLDGDKLIYSFVDPTGMMTADMLQPQLDAMESTYGPLFTGWKDAGYNISALVLEYVDASGKTIASKEFN